MPGNSMWMASKDVAEKLDIHVRTVRNWIDTFSPYMVLQKNSQGHFLLSEQAFNLLIEIKRVKDSGVQTLKEVEEVLLAEHILPERKMLKTEPDEMIQTLSFPEETTFLLMEKINELESHLSRQLCDTLNELTQAHRQSASVQEHTPMEPDLMFTQYYKEILRKIDEMEKKQDTLRLEMRKMNFEVQMLSVTTKQEEKKKKRFAWPLFRKSPDITSPS
jgi:DNA-binding transcriptional MerR regulator